MTRPDCIVIGGGLIGLLTARELAQGGRRVTLLERGRSGGESSWAGGGILSPLYPWRYPDAVTALASWSQPRYPALAEELFRQTGIDSQWLRSGMLMVNIAPGEQAQAEAWAARHGIGLEPLDETALHECEQALTPNAKSALWMPSVAQVRNPRLSAALREAARQDGIELREQVEARRIVIENGRAAGVATTEGILHADTVIVAAGAWSAALLEPAGVSVPITPVRGQMILFRAAPDTLGRIVLLDGRYLIPRRDGHILAGSTMEQAGFDKSLTAAAREQLIQAALAMVPALARYPVVNHWAGLRPGSPQGVPFIGPVPGIDGIYLNAGHFRNGVVTAPASARLLADIVLGRPPVVDPALFRLPR